MAKFPDTEWRTAQVRLTVFPTPESIIRLPEWWQRMTGAEPNQSTTDRKRNTTLVSGDLGTGTLTLALAPERVDWFLTTTEGILDSAAAVDEIGPMVETFDEFSKLAERWLGSNDLPDAARIAFGVVLNHPEVDKMAGYKKLPDYVPVRIEPDWRDFVFQINIPGHLDPEEYGVPYLNRLSRWSVFVLRTGRLMVGDQGVISEGGPPKYGLRLELDINTPADSLKPLPRPKLVALYQELVSAGRSIARNGVAHEQYRLQ